MRTRRFALVLCPLAFVLAAACGDDDDDDSAPVPILDPEPAGAPEDVADGVDPDGRSTLTCLGHNTPPAPDGSTLTLPGWVRTYADPTNDGDVQPTAESEAFDADGTSLGSAFSDTGNGRVAITVPIRATGFVGSVEVRADGFLEQRFASSRAVTTTAAAGWSWLVTEEEVAAIATEADVEVDPAKGIVVGSVHDCDIFGVANAVVRVDGRTDGVVFFDEFAVAAGRTFTADSGRFAVPNVDPGTVTVEAFGRTRAGGPLELLSLAEIEVTAGMVSAVDLEPRVGATR